MRKLTTIFFQRPIVLRIASFIIGLVSIFGSIAAWSYSDSREPYRYLVAAFVMIASGILWLVCSVIPKFVLSKKQTVILLSVLLLGFAFGLFNTFFHCGGECGCFWDYGYPGRWLRISTCVTGPIEPIWMRTWRIDFPSFVADVVFWSGMGLIVAVIWSVTKEKVTTPTAEK